MNEIYNQLDNISQSNLLAVIISTILVLMIIIKVRDIYK